MTDATRDAVPGGPPPVAPAAPWRVALYGGSFDPPHIAHVLSVAYALSVCDVDEVWVAPVFAHAFGKPLSPFEDRLRLCRAAFALFGDRVVVSRCEAQAAAATGSENRTIDTVHYLQRAHPGIAFSLLLGSDLFAERHRWKDFEGLQALVAFHVVGRSGAPEPPPGVRVGPALPAVSSTMVRARLARGESVAELVAPAVLALIRARGLYV